MMPVTFEEALLAATDDTLVLVALRARAVYEFALEEACDQAVLDEARETLQAAEAEITRRRRVNDAATD